MANFSLERIFPADLQRQMSARRLQEIRSLARERDPEIFHEGMLALAGRLEQDGDVAGAAELYSALLTPHPGPLPVGERGLKYSPGEQGPTPSPRRGEGVLVPFRG